MRGIGIVGKLWLAPLRGVTIRAFRETFAEAIREAGFVGAFAPFIPANPGIRVNDRLLADLSGTLALPVVPQVITKHPDAIRTLLRAFRARFPKKDVWAWTGCIYEEDLLKESPWRCEVTDEMLSLIDTLVDGPFIENQKDVTLVFRGSSNQRIIDLRR